jgi:hypothetical protein
MKSELSVRFILNTYQTKILYYKQISAIFVYVLKMKILTNNSKYEIFKTIYIFMPCQDIFQKKKKKPPKLINIYGV